jgi:hypothetical protein
MAIEEQRGHVARKVAGCVKAAELSVITPSQTADLIPILWLRPSLLDIRFQTNQRAPELLSMAAAQLHRKVLILLGNRLGGLEGTLRSRRCGGGALPS